ncbi:MAG: dephospho-CoA kinase [Lachnospiraceae bacterium]|nr:dephospho-CoA kinase [Lachnospiraceae bacterium]
MIIGVTGGVGAGKSEVLRFLHDEFHAVILEMDAIGKKLMEPGEACYDRICDLFGNEAVKEDGTLDRPYIANIVFHEPDKLEALNSIVHPAVREYCDCVIRETQNQEKALIILESAILLDAGYDTVCDEVWYIYTDEKTRARRLRISRGYSDERIRAVMSSQKSEEFFREHADFVLENSGSLEEMKQQIRERFAASKLQNTETEERPGT